jgi:hypothetical protein
MRFECKTKIEKAWLVASILIFVAHRLLEPSAQGYYSVATPLRLWLEVAMVVLSFPLGGLTMFIVHSSLSWGDNCQDLEFLLDWSLLLFAGYIQWFWVLPEFLRGRKLTFLSLKGATGTISPHASSAADIEAAMPAAPVDAALPGAFDAAPLPAFDAAAFVPALAEFDEAGLTALDRVFQAQTSPTAQATPSHVEAIFPRVS